VTGVVIDLAVFLLAAAEAGFAPPTSDAHARYCRHPRVAAGDFSPISRDGWRFQCIQLFFPGVTHCENPAARGRSAASSKRRRTRMRELWTGDRSINQLITINDQLIGDSAASTTVPT
jgi:hypothetical protein